MLILVGPPAAGKSTFCNRYLVPNGYERINMDTLKTKAKCKAAAKKALDSGKSVVIDNTNPSEEARSLYIEMAKVKNVPCRCFFF